MAAAFIASPGRENTSSSMVQTGRGHIGNIGVESKTRPDVKAGKVENGKVEEKRKRVCRERGLGYTKK